MPKGHISDDVQRFIYEHLDSVEQLDVLLLLRREASRAWTPPEISAELRTNASSVANRLRSLVAIGLVEESAEEPGRFHYAPRTPASEQLVSELAEAYKIRRHKIYELIFSPMKRARNFANAFVVKSYPKNGDEDG